MDPIINYWVVLGAGLFNFLLGALWYSPLMFAKMWMAASGKTEEDLKRGGQARGLLIGLAGSLITAFVLAHFVKLMNVASIENAVELGFWAWLGFVVTTKLADLAFEGQSRVSFLIYVAYELVAFLGMAVILALWA